MLEVLIDKDNGLPRGKTSVKIMSACPLIRGANDGPIADLRRPLSESQLRESAASKKKEERRSRDSECDVSFAQCADSIFLRQTVCCTSSFSVRLA